MMRTIYLLFVIALTTQARNVIRRETENITDNDTIEVMPAPASINIEQPEENPNDICNEVECVDGMKCYVEENCTDTCTLIPVCRPMPLPCPTPSCNINCKVMNLPGRCPFCECPKTKEEACLDFECPGGYQCGVIRQDCDKGNCQPICLVCPVPSCEAYCSPVMPDKGCMYCECPKTPEEVCKIFNEQTKCPGNLVCAADEEKCQNGDCKPYCKGEPMTLQEA